MTLRSPVSLLMLGPAVSFLALVAGCSDGATRTPAGAAPTDDGGSSTSPPSPSGDAGSPTAPGSPAPPSGSSGDASAPSPGAPPSSDAGVASSDAGVASSDAGAAESARAKVLAFLAGISGKQTAIGIEDKDSSNPHADSDTMASMAKDGQNPSFWSADWGFGSGAVSSRGTIVKEAIRQWGEGAIVQFIYHTCPLTMNEDCQWTDVKGSSLSDQQWSDLITPGGTLNKAWLARLDTLAAFFQQVKAAGVAPLFRPLHEMNGSWAWWQGRPGPDGSLKLYQITHDYLVKTKGLDNIVWVWNVQDYTTLADDVTKYNPGPSYFDVAALDVYNTGYTQGNYDAMKGAAGGKPIGVAECQNLPTTSVLAQQPLWAYVAMWPDFFSDNTSSIPALFGDPSVLTLSKMPGWK